MGVIAGPALSGTLVNTIGFEWMLFGTAMLCFMYAPLMYFLKSPPTKEEKKVIKLFYSKELLFNLNMRKIILSVSDHR